MGIDADKYFVMNGLATLGNCYIRVKDFNNTKIDGNHTFRDSVEILVNGKLTTADMKFLQMTAPITGNNWQLAYDHLKEELTKQGITFTDNI